MVVGTNGAFSGRFLPLQISCLILISFKFVKYDMKLNFKYRILCKVWDSKSWKEVFVPKIRRREIIL